MFLKVDKLACDKLVKKKLDRNLVNGSYIAINTYH